MTDENKISDQPRYHRFCIECSKPVEELRWSLGGHRARTCSDICWIEAEHTFAYFDNLFIDEARARAALRKAVFDRDNNQCKHCGSEEQLSVDHIIPQSKDGSDDLDNLQTLCKRCNSSKGTGLDKHGAEKILLPLQ